MTAQTSPFMLDVSNLVDERIEASIFRAVVTAIEPDSVRIKRTGQFNEDEQDYAACDIYPFPQIGDEVLVLRAGRGFVVLGRIVRSGIDVLHTGLANLVINGQLLITVGGSILIGDMDPPTNGGIVLDENTFTAYKSGGAGSLTIDANGIVVISDTGDPFFRIQDSAGDRSTNFVADTAAGRSNLRLQMDQVASGRKIETIWIDSVITANLCQNISDELAFGATAIGAVFWLHCFNASTGASLGHIFGSMAAGGTALSATTTVGSAASTGTAPSVQLHSSDGFEFCADAAVNTRFVGLIVVAYL